MTKRILLVLLASLAIGVQAFAQNVSGKVADAKGEAIPGASVIVKGTTTGTMTDLDGAYQLNAGSNATLVFSCIGYASQEIAVGGKGVINVVLTEDSTLLEETVVVAYGTAKKKDLTGAIGTVDNKTLTVQAQGSVTRMLDGQVAGLQTTSGDGQPGLDMVIRVRGLGTANPNSSSALIVIDGAPAIEGTNPLSSINSNDIESITVLKDAASTALYGARGANGVVLVTTKSGKAGKTKVSLQARWGVNTLDSNSKIKKIGDGGANEIYEATWEAIYNDLVYRKSQDKGYAAKFASEHLFDYNGSLTSFGINGLGNRMAYKVPNAVYTKTGTSSSMSGAYLVNPDGKINPDAQLIWDGGCIADDVVTARFRQEYVASATGATDKVDYHVSLGYLSDPSYIAMSGFERYTARANVNAQVTSWLKTGAKFSYAHRKTNSIDYRGNANTNRNIGTNTENPFVWYNWATVLDQTYARDLNGNFKYDANGNRLVSMHSGQNVPGTAYHDTPLGTDVNGMLKSDVTALNPIAYFNNQTNSQVYDDLSMKGYARASFLKHFTAEVNISYDATFGNKTRYFDRTTSGIRMARNGLANSSSIGRTKTVYTVLNTQQLINYNQDFGKNHVDAMVGHEYYEYNYEKQNYASAYNLVDGSMAYANFLGTAYYKFLDGSNNGDLSKLAMESYLGRVNYNYDEKYYLSASMRYDGSSKFKLAEKRWGLFWSVGAGWRISSEPWMEGAKDWLSNLKVRASYGVTGNQNGVDYYSGYQLWTYGGADWTAGSTTYPQSVTLTKKTYSYAEDLTWEKVHTTDAGVDFTLFGGKVSGTFDWFNKETPNAIYSQNLSYNATGQSTFTSNCAGIRSTGIEIELSYQPVKTKDWDVILSTNGTHYRTTLTKVPDTFGSAELGGCETASATGIDIAGTGADVPNCYLRGVGKDFYNLYLYRYAGVAGNTGVTYYDANNVAHTGYTAGDLEAGRPLYYHKVTAAEAAAGTFGSAKEGDDIRTTKGDLASKYEVGSAIPAWIGGFNASVRYKGFDLGVMFSYQIGGKYYSVEYANGGDGGRYNGSSNIRNNERAISRELYGNTWSENRPDAKFPMLCYSSSGDGGAAIGDTQNYTDLALFDASYLSIKNITLGYTFPSKWMSKAKISNLRIFASADNPVMIYSHSGVDPRRSISGGTDLGAAQYPYLAVYTFGINLDF